MQDINFLAIAAVTVGAFILSGVWYGIFAKPMAALSKGAAADMGPVQILLELARSAVVATVLAVLLQQLNVTSALQGAGYGLLLWVGFPVVLLIGSIMHEKVRPQLAAIHAGDWLVKLVFIATILSIWK